MEMTNENSNEKFRVSFGIDRTDEQEIRDFILSCDFLENIIINDLGFIADLEYENIKVISGKLMEKGVSLFSIMRKGADK